jgi:demethylmenaquinone methyltransferase/2-methoxy-6-polyprenyl-1,4-benzoquinol methylase
MNRNELPQGDEKTRRVRAMFDTIAARYEFINFVMTFGLDRRWRRTCVSELRLPPQSTVLDVAAGTGDFIRELARQGYRAIATDLSYGMLSAGHGMPERVHADALHLPLIDGAVDGITCGYALRNFTDLGGTLIEMGRVVRPGGRIVLLEVAEPSNHLLRVVFTFWFRRVVPIVGGLLSDRDAYKYLPKSTAYLPDAVTLAAMLRDAGFVAVNHRLIMRGLSQRLIATKAS